MLKNSSTQFIFSATTTRTTESQRGILGITWTFTRDHTRVSVNQVTWILTPDFSLKIHYQRNCHTVLVDPSETKTFTRDHTRVSVNQVTWILTPDFSLKI